MDYFIVAVCLAVFGFGVHLIGLRRPRRFRLYQRGPTVQLDCGKVSRIVIHPQIYYDDMLLVGCSWQLTSNPLAIYAKWEQRPEFLEVVEFE